MCNGEENRYTEKGQEYETNKKKNTKKGRKKKTKRNKQ